MNTQKKVEKPQFKYASEEEWGKAKPPHVSLEIFIK